jgi:hypothetical protein
MATTTQTELIKDMLNVLDNEFDYGDIGKKQFYTGKEAYNLISLNKDMFYGIIDGGQCTVRQYNILTKIAGRPPKYERHLIGYTQAVEWINKYTRKAV